MRRFLHIVAKTLSILLYPIWMPTYGMLLFCTGVRAYIPLTTAAWLVTILGTALITVVIPLTAILVRIRKGKVHDLYIEKSEERTLPYLYTFLCYICWCYLLIRILSVPVTIALSATGASLALLTVMVINRWWKISAHLTGMGGLLGGVISFSLFFYVPALPLIILLLFISLLLMYARIYLNAHSPMQTVCGLLLGLSCTLLPNLIYLYVQSLV